MPRTVLAAIALTHCSCASAPWSTGPKDKTIYALGSIEGFASPIGTPMTPACPALKFTKGSLESGPQHDRTLRMLADEGKGKNEARFVIDAYCHPGLPPEYARVLSEKRAHSVRQKLIEMGVAPDGIQTAGFGNDFVLNGPANDVVVIYKTETARQP